MNHVPVLAIDGPGGSGKGTVAYGIAQSRNWHILDSGALYRAFSFAADQRRISPKDNDGLREVFDRSTIDFVMSSVGELQVQVDGIDVTTRIRSAEGGILASKYASVDQCGININSEAKDLGLASCWASNHFSSNKSGIRTRRVGVGSCAGRTRDMNLSSRCSLDNKSSGNIGVPNTIVGASRFGMNIVSVMK